jgi:hypothetical protein
MVSSSVCIHTVNVVNLANASISLLVDVCSLNAFSFCFQMDDVLATMHEPY